jgi:hypothetical protein
MRLWSKRFNLGDTGTPPKGNLINTDKFANWYARISWRDHRHHLQLSFRVFEVIV